MSKATKPKPTNKIILATSLPINIPHSLPKSFDFPHTTIEDTFTNSPDLHPGKELIGVFWFDSL